MISLKAMGFSLGGAGIALWALTLLRRAHPARTIDFDPKTAEPAVTNRSPYPEEALSERRDAMLRRALRAARMIAWEYDPQTGRITVELDEKVFGISAPPSWTTPRKVLSRVHEMDRAAVWNRALAALEQNEPYIQQLRLKLDRSDEYLWMENHACVIAGEHGRPASLAGTIIDFTAHKRAVDALVESDRRKDIFLATLAHELRNPLASLRAATHLLGEAGLDLEERHGCIKLIRRQARHLTHLINDLLHIARITQNRLRLERVRLDLRACVREAIEMVEHLPQTQEQTITVTMAVDPAYVYADRVRIVQVLVNLLTNAIKYTPARGRIDISTQREGPHCVVRVRDTGIGIPLDQQARVFEPFFQVADSVSQSSGGLGIGLALARRIIDLHGGTIELISGGSGRGCEFLVRLPLLNEIGVDQSVAMASPPLPADRSLRILVADDNSDVAEAMAIALRMCGHAVRVAGDGDEALRIAEEFHPEVALLDLQMPKLGGGAVARMLRERRWASGTTLVALTGWSLENLGDRPELAFFDSHILKPADIDRIAKLVSEVARCGPTRAPDLDAPSSED